MGVDLQEKTDRDDARFHGASYAFSTLQTRNTVIAAIVPAHNEEDQIRSCLTALRVAAQCPRLCGEQTVLIVVLDACTDSTRRIAREMGATTIALHACNVGAARDLGAQLALAAGARWLAFIDADTPVAPDWISAQLALNSEVICGTVNASYIDADGHRRLHGANLGMSARAYERAGGFRPLNRSEDLALIEALQASGALIAWTATPRVVTSAKPALRALGGFGATFARTDQHSQTRRPEKARA